MLVVSLLVTPSHVLAKNVFFRMYKYFTFFLLTTSSFNAQSSLKAQLYSLNNYPLQQKESLWDLCRRLLFWKINNFTAPRRIPIESLVKSSMPPQLNPSNAFWMLRQCRSYYVKWMQHIDEEIEDTTRHLSFLTRAMRTFTS